MAHLLSEFEAELGSLAEEVPKPNARVPKPSSKASAGKDTVGRKKVDKVVDKDVERAPKERPSSSSSSKRSSSKRVSSAPGSLGKGGRPVVGGA